MTINSSIDRGDILAYLYVLNWWPVLEKLPAPNPEYIYGCLIRLEEQLERTPHLSHVLAAIKEREKLNGVWSVRTSYDIDTLWRDPNNWALQDKLVRATENCANLLFELFQQMASNPIRSETLKLAVAQFIRRQNAAKSQGQIKNEDLHAGQPCFFYCKECGIFLEKLPEDYLFAPLRRCSQCEGLEEQGWLQVAKNTAICDIPEDCWS